MDNNFYMQQSTMKRFTRAEVYQAIQLHCYQQTGVPVTNTVKLEDTPTQLRHSCFSTGITFLQQYTWQVLSDLGVINVPYYFCEKCGKLYVYNHIYD